MKKRRRKTSSELEKTAENLFWSGKNGVKPVLERSVIDARPDGLLDFQVEIVAGSGVTGCEKTGHSRRYSLKNN
jgi:hypothetical protein